MRGTMSPRKAQHQLVEALSRVEKSCHGSVFLWAPVDRDSALRRAGRQQSAGRFLCFAYFSLTAKWTAMRWQRFTHADVFVFAVAV